jgi:flagellar protein FlaG
MTMSIAATYSLSGLLPSAAPERPAPPRAKPSVERAVSAVSEMLSPLARGLEFAVDGTTGETVVRVVDRDTHEVVRQIPSREMLAIARALDRVQGLLIQAKA